MAPRRHAARGDAEIGIRHAIADAEDRMKVLDRQIEGMSRKRDTLKEQVEDYQTALRVLQRLANGKADSAESEPAPPPRDPKQDESGAGPSSRNGSDTNAAKPPRHPLIKPPSMAAIIREIVADQKGEFSPTTIDDLVSERFPDVRSKMPSGYVSSQLWKMSEKDEIEVVRRGGSGRPNIYRLPQTTATTP